MSKVKKMLPAFSLFLLFSNSLYSVGNEILNPHKIFSKFPSLNIPQVAGEGYFEWIDVLEAVDEAEDQFVLIEVGAGLGSRGKDAAKAADARGIPYSLVFIEAEPFRAKEGIDQEMKNNNIPQSKYTIFPYCVGTNNQQIMFYITSEKEGLDLKNWYGQRSIFEEDKIIRWSNKEYMGQKVVSTSYGYEAVMVEQKKLSDLLNLVDKPIIDICDFDIQGSEVDVIIESMDIINQRVKRLHIGTHSREIERQLRKILTQNGWRLICNYSCCQENDTEYGSAKFTDGVQTWHNSRLM